jgi:hypothetical protein
VLRPLALVVGLATAAVLLQGAGNDPGGGLTLDAAASGPVRLAPAPPEPADDDAAPHAFATARRDGTGRPALFDPCRPVRWAVRREGELLGADLLVSEAVQQVAAGTGLEFVREPDVTGALPTVDQLGQRNPDGSFPPAVVAWSTEDERPELGNGTLAVGGGSSWAPEGRSGEERLVSGLVALDGEALSDLRSGLDGDARLRGVLLHELAHLVGLGHVDDASQLLNAESSGTAFAAGDLRGLHAAGQGQCFQDW